MQLMYSNPYRQVDRIKRDEKTKHFRQRENGGLIEKIQED